MCQQSISSVSESRLKDRLTQKVASKGAWQASVLANEWTARDLWVVKPDVLGASEYRTLCKASNQSTVRENEHVNIASRMLAKRDNGKDKKTAKKSGPCPRTVWESAHTLLELYAPTHYWLM